MALGPTPVSFVSDCNLVSRTFDMSDIFILFISNGPLHLTAVGA